MRAMESHAGSVVGVIYTPETDVTINGGQASFTGSVTFNQLRINGNPNFSMQYDDTIATITVGSWTVTNWREVPSA